MELKYKCGPVIVTKYDTKAQEKLEDIEAIINDILTTKSIVKGKDEYSKGAVDVCKTIKKTLKSKNKRQKAN